MKGKNKNEKSLVVAKNAQREKNIFQVKVPFQENQAAGADTFKLIGFKIKGKIRQNKTIFIGQNNPSNNPDNTNNSAHKIHEREK